MHSDCCFELLELHGCLVIEYFIFAVLVALYEEPEKPSSALEYPFLSSILWIVSCCYKQPALFGYSFTVWNTN